MMTGLGRLSWRLAVHRVPRGRGVLIVDDQEHPQIDALLALLHAAYPRVNLFDVATKWARGSAAGPVRASDAFPAIAIAAPLAWSPVVRRYLRRLKIQAILLNAATGAPEPFLTAAQELGIKLVCFGPPVPREANRNVALCCVSTSQRAAAIAAGVPATSIVVDATSADLLERLAPMLVSERAPGKVANALEAQLIHALRGPLLGRIAARKFRAIESLPALRERLAAPARILCLGNGPSSEDPALRELSYDALFRVNHSWIDGAHHTRPDVIFTGKRDTLDAYRGPTIFGLQTEDAASRIVLRSILLARRFTYFTAERLGCMDFGFFAPYKPTNGAVMIATAAALATQQLIVAGIDLFSDPRGSYPGDAATPNAYTVAHDREVEARFVLETMAAFHGEVIVVGDVLEARWRRHRLGASPHRIAFRIRICHVSVDRVEQIVQDQAAPPQARRRLCGHRQSRAG